MIPDNKDMQKPDDMAAKVDREDLLKKIEDMLDTATDDQLQKVSDMLSAPEAAASDVVKPASTDELAMGPKPSVIDTGVLDGPRDGLKNFLIKKQRDNQDQE